LGGGGDGGGEAQSWFCWRGLLTRRKVSVNCSLCSQKRYFKNLQSLL